MQVGEVGEECGWDGRALAIKDTAKVQCQWPVGLRLGADDRGSFLGLGKHMDQNKNIP